MSNNQDTKVALVTGAARRIGAEIVRTLHSHGFNVILHFNHSQNDMLAKELNRIRADSITTIGFDLHETGRISNFVDDIIGFRGRLDALVNNASTFYPTPIAEMTESQWDDLLGVNLKAPAFLSKYLAPHLIGSRGNIINIVDIHGDRPLKNYPVYSIAKAGLIMLTKSLARELAPNVRVNAIAPGAILWPEVKAYESIHQEIIEKTALKREGHPHDIANTVWFLLQATNYITGQIIAVDGGRTLSN